MVKIPIREIIVNSYNVNLTYNDLQTKEYLIKQTDSPFLDQIEILRGRKVTFIKEVILVCAPKNPKTQQPLTDILYNGFLFNGKRYLRFGKSSAQGKQGITVFVIEDIFNELYQRSQLDIKMDNCVISKYESQRCLIFSSCTLIRDYFPRIVIIDEYEKTIPDQLIRYVQSEQRQYENKETGKKGTYTARIVKEGKRDIKLSPFDGSGCHELEFSMKISEAIGLDYTAVGAQVRLPYMKGYSVYVPFRQIFHEWGINTITDIYGKTHNIDEVDCIWNISMFKGHKIFKKKYGNDAWDKYLETLHKYNFKLGISKYSHHLSHINRMARMNFQYLQCLDFWNPKYVEWFNDRSQKYDILSSDNQGKIIELAKYTTDLFEKIIKGDRFYTFKFMGKVNDGDYDDEDQTSAYMKAVLLNDSMLGDPAVQHYIYSKLQKSIDEAKIGKIYASGFYHTLVGDMLGYLEYACGKEVIGCLKAHEFYCETINKGEAVSFRSPLVDCSEVNKVNIVSNEITRKWFSYFKDQDVVMINMYDLSLPQQGGAKLHWFPIQ